MVLSFFQGYSFGFCNSLFSSYVDWFHNFSCSLLFGVLVFVVFIFLYILFNSFYFKSKIDYHFGEFMCSLFPTLILLFQMFPSLGILYYYGLMNIDSSLTIKVTGHQWYWNYNYSDIGLCFDSYMKSIDSLLLGEYRLLEVDNRCIVPCDVNVRFCVTSADVIHSWSLPCFSIKADAMSGILSVVNYSFPMVGVFYGQCSEICGANHSFMPICVEVTTVDCFISWIYSMVGF
uniref:Cytochrome c oxidase subunit 2 n=1 Tax=Strongyloides cebus TaxID=174719 RepID=A0A977IW61_9BILA|nr:cytochrome c oxidase subunit II [Strongyloides cebus]UWK23992.1 cytochrome c oxidase subunit II [Strongyloides cebus]